MNATVVLTSVDGSNDPQRSARTRRRARRTLMLLAFVSVLPVAASYFTFYAWQPQGRVNHGTLIAPAPLPQHGLLGLGGQVALSRAELEGQWTLLVAAPASCEAACARALYVSRQARLAQAQEVSRVGRVYLVTGVGEPAADRLRGHEGLRLAKADAAWLAALPQADAEGGAVFLVDPLGNVMMRFADDPDTTQTARGITKDLQRLLKYSALGRGTRE